MSRTIKAVYRTVKAPAGVIHNGRHPLSFGSAAARFGARRFREIRALLETGHVVTCHSGEVYAPADLESFLDCLNSI